MSEYNIINVTLSEGDNKEKAYCKIVRCKNSKNCGLYKRGECAWLALLDWQKCPYGDVRRETGFTKRAKSHYDWVSSRRSLYKNQIHKLKWHSKMMTIVGDYVFLPYSYMTMNKNIPFLAHGGFFMKENCFFPKEHFNIKNIISICDFRPQSLIGGEITTYQTEEVPQFLKHLSEQIPDIFQDLCKKYDRAKQIVEESSNVGRKALLKTVVPSVISLNNEGEWTWDGEYLTSHNYRSAFMPVSNFSEIRIKPTEDCSVIITNDEQVNEDTVFFS